MTGDGTTSLSAADEGWLELLGHFTPVKSLARLDAQAARLIPAVSVVGLAVAGFGTFAGADAIRLRSTNGWLAVAVVVTATLSVAFSLVAQFPWIRRFRAGDLGEARRWYLRQLKIRGGCTLLASLLLPLSLLLALWLALVLAGAPTERPQLSIVQIAGPAGQTTSISVRFEGLEAADQVQVTATGPDKDVLAVATFLPAAGGIVERTITLPPVVGRLAVLAVSRNHGCAASVGGLQPPSVSCH